MNAAEQEARDAAAHAFGGLRTRTWANAYDSERDYVRAAMDDAIDAYLAVRGLLPEKKWSNTK